MLAPLVARSSRCIYRCTYRANNSERVSLRRSEPRSSQKNGCEVCDGPVIIIPPANDRGAVPTLSWSDARGNQEMLIISPPTTIIRSTAMSGQKYLYTIPEAADSLACCTNTIYNWIKSGRLFVVYPFSKARIPQSSIDSLVRELEIESREAKIKRNGAGR
jgi:hypothetical protein